MQERLPINWIIENQLGRRNLTPEQKLYLIGKKYKEEKKEYGGDRKSEKSRAQNVPLISTAQKIAEQHKVSHDTVKRAEKFAEALYGRVGELKVVELPGLQEAEDIIDWAKVSGNTKERLVEFIRGTPAWIPTKEKPKENTTGLDLTRALMIGSDLQMLDMPVSWLVKGLIPQQAITLLSAKGGMGKTILSISIADAVSKGVPFLGLETIKTPVVYIDFENSLPTLIERVRRIDASEVMFWHPSNEIKPPRLDSKEFDQFKELPPGALLIFDTLRASQSRDENDSQHMAMVMQRLKELRDLGFTILILHHTSKYDDKTYKGSTVIYDLCDHNLSFFKVKKGCLASEENTEDDNEDFCYRLGTMHKTRFEPFHIFLEFDVEKGCFVIAPDPETEILDEIYSLLSGKELKQSDVCELVKKELGIKNKPKVLRLLKKGVMGGCFEERKHPGGKAIFYVVNEKFNSSGLYTRTIELLSKTTKPIVHEGRTIANQDHPASRSGAVLSNSSTPPRTIGTIAENHTENSSSDMNNSSSALNYCTPEKTNILDAKNEPVREPESLSQEQQKITTDDTLKVRREGTGKRNDPFRYSTISTSLLPSIYTEVEKEKRKNVVNPCDISTNST